MIPRLLVVLACLALAASVRANPDSTQVTVAAEDEHPDTCKLGIYVLSLYDLDYPNNQFASDFWMWTLSTADSLRPLETVELTNSKSYAFSNGSVELRNGVTWSAQKVKATIRMNWDITDFPFDQQTMRIEIEDAEHDASSLVYIPDTANSKLDPRVKLDGWHVSDLELVREESKYNTSYGDPDLNEASSYSAIVAYVHLRRSGLGLFFKLFTGVYVAFAICLMVFFFEQEEIEARFSLLVGALFAAVANKYIVDSYLPLSSSFALVDKVHVITFVYILISIGVSVYSMHHERIRRTREGDDYIAGTRVDRIAFWTLLVTYVGINGFYLIRAL